MGSSLVRESVDSSTGDDDKLYFFFTERSQERATAPSRGRVAAVARVCKVSAARKRRRGDWLPRGKSERYFLNVLSGRLSRQSL